MKTNKDFTNEEIQIINQALKRDSEIKDESFDDQDSRKRLINELMALFHTLRNSDNKDLERKVGIQATRTALDWIYHGLGYYRKHGYFEKEGHGYLEKNTLEAFEEFRSMIKEKLDEEDSRR